MERTDISNASFVLVELAFNELKRAIERCGGYYSWNEHNELIEITYHCDGQGQLVYADRAVIEHDKLKVYVVDEAYPEYEFCIELMMQLDAQDILYLIDKIDSDDDVSIDGAQETIDEFVTKLKSL